LSKRLYKLLNEEAVWQELLHNKYLRQRTLSEVKAKPTDSPSAKGLMGLKDDFFSRGFFKVGNGAVTHFWEDTWLEKLSLAQQYPSLYNIMHHKNVTVAHVVAQTPLNISFRTPLMGNKWTLWLELCQKLLMVNLNGENDRFVWNLTSNGLFTVKYMYEDLINDHTPFFRKYLWKVKVPLKIKKMWFLSNKMLLTKDNLAKHRWNGCTKCVFLWRTGDY
jgi:hypothetical protein